MMNSPCPDCIRAESDPLWGVIWLGRWCCEARHILAAVSRRGQTAREAQVAAWKLIRDTGEPGYVEQVRDRLRVLAERQGVAG